MKEKIKEIKKEKKRELVVPGDVLASGPEFLPGDGTIREKQNIIAVRFGLLDKSDRLIRVIPLSGPYIPRPGNMVIGQVTDNSVNGWFVDINSPYPGFLTIAECSEYISKKNDLSSYYKVGDMIIAKVLGYKGRSIDLTMKGHGLHKLNSGFIIKINPNCVPRVIGREGSMINLIKKSTNTNITIGQNGVIWIKGNNIESELLAKESIEFISEKPFIDGLTDEIEKFLQKKKKTLKNGIQKKI